MNFKRGRKNPASFFYFNYFTIAANSMMMDSENKMLYKMDCPYVCTYGNASTNTDNPCDTIEDRRANVDVYDGGTCDDSDASHTSSPIQFSPQCLL